MAINSRRDDEDLEESLKIDVLRRLFGYLLSYKKQIVIVTSLIIITVAIGILFPLLVQYIIDVPILNRDIKMLVIMVAVVLVFALINMICNMIWRKIMANVSNDVVLKIRRELYVHIQGLGVDFFDSRPAGKILARVTGDVNSLKDVLSSTITQLIPEAITVVAVFIVMLTVSPLLTFSAVTAIPIIIVGVFFCEILAHKRWQLMRKKESNMTAFIHEDIAGIGIIQSFSAQEEATTEFNDIVDEHKEAFRKAVQVADIFSPTIEISFGVGSFTLYYLAIKVMKLDVASVGTLTAFAMYMGMFFGPIRNLANYYNKLITNISAAERIFEIMDTPATVQNVQGAQPMPPLEGTVCFDHVAFAYPDEPEKLILTDVCFEVNKGETIALVGPTGAGKTTIVSLISRFYNTSSGTVYIDGMDISQVEISSLRDQLGIMTQDNYLFSGTIKDNIKYGKPDATDDEIISAAKAVHAHDFIMKLEKGYETEISERGGGLSIGERQLIAFARTLMQDPKILILDEATSNIDTRTELLVQQGIEELLKKRTSFVVAHRLSTIRNADKIFVIDDGGIQECGTHDELMEKRGAYYNLAMMRTK